MKKSIGLILFLAAPVLADINVTPGVGKTIHSDTVNGTEYQVIKIVDGTSGGTSSAAVTTVGLKVDLTTTTVSNSTVGVVGTIAATQSGNWSLIGSTSGAVQVGNWTVIQSSFGVTGSSIATFQGGTWTVQPGNVPNTAGWLVQLSSSIPAGSNSIGTIFLSTVQVVQSTLTVSAIQGALPAGSNSIGTVLLSTVQVVNSTVGAVGFFANNGVAAATDRVNVLPAIAQNAYGNNGSAYTQGRNAAQMVLTKSGLVGTWSGPDITLNSYSASTNTFTIFNTTQDVTALCGNQTSTVAVTGLRVSCTQTTAGVIPISIAKRSTAYTGAWSTITATAEDSNYAVVSSTAIFSTAAGLTNGTLVSYVDSGLFECPAPATTNDGIYISPANWRMKPIVLRGPSQCLGVNLQATSAAGAKFVATWEWMEITSP